MQSQGEDNIEITGPPLIQLRLKFLWETARQFSLEKTSSSLACHFGTELKRVAAEFGVSLPSSMLDSLCTSCSVPLIPGVTCCVRIKKLPKSKKNDCKKSRRKSRNQILKSCKICGNPSSKTFPGSNSVANISPGNSVRRSKASKKKSIGTMSSDFIRLSAAPRKASAKSSPGRLLLDPKRKRQKKNAEEKKVQPQSLSSVQQLLGSMRFKF
uniref:Uncharacterized protein n=1 Tax=Octactis speculum TaxID=3111310 RepID=A0A7S2MM34_9STRA|mmetsp:Transcript_65016/g.89351  ORF Transcript_65016/g.89351 Transcript_65016/m.89351 type:complete len:212 (+) Transcript_65016:126-761(+)